MRQLSPLDTAFLQFESPRTPMHIGGLYIFENQNAKKPFNYQEFVAHINSRLNSARLFQEKLVEVPMGLDRPYWVKDGEFDAELHCSRIGLAPPYDLETLMRMAADIFTKPLDRSRPLWEAVFIEGLNKVDGVKKGSFAIIFKVHHCAIDGVSGEEILEALLDISADKNIDRTLGENALEESKRKAENPGAVKLLAKSVPSSMLTPIKAVQLIGKSRGLMIKSFRKRWLEKGESPPLYFSAPKAIFDQSVSPHRIFSGTQLPLEKVKAIKNSTDTYTVNDVILAVCAGALKKYLEEKEELPWESLIAMAPISTRSSDQKGSHGNKVSSMLISLATTTEDPKERLAIISEHASKAKEYNKLLPIDSLLDYIPPIVQKFATGLVRNARYSGNPNPIFNLVVTNIPGPQFPLFFNGAKLHSQYGLAPIFDGMGLSIVIMSYNGSIGVGINACRELMPDVDQFAIYIDQALEELEISVLGKQAEQEAIA